MSLDSLPTKPIGSGRACGSQSFKAESVFRTWCDSLRWAAEATERISYRGQREDWDLQTHLDREFTRLGVEGRLRVGAELNLMREFRRKYAAADSAAVLETIPHTLATMRHHGAPTRLLDWTYSRFIALFFALREAVPIKAGDRTDEDLKGDPSLPTVWCVNVDFFRKQAGQERLFSRLPHKTDKHFVRTFFQSREPRVAMVNSYLLSERLQLQQAVFMAPSNLEKSFHQNLLAVPGATQPENVRAFKFAFEAAELKRALAGLWRMNLSDAALFPGLDGFCRSFSQRICLFADDPVLGTLDVIEGPKPRKWRPLPIGEPSPDTA